MAGLLIRYEQDISAHDDNPSRFKGEEYVVADEAAAKRYHPFAKIIGPENEAPFAESGEAGISQGAQEIPAWYTKRKDAAAAEGHTIPDYEPGELAANFDRRAKAFADEQEAKAKAEAESGEAGTGQGDEDSNAGDAGAGADAGDNAGGSGDAS